MIDIFTAHQPREIEVARQLFLEYQEGLGIDLCFQDFASELERLPGAYAPPGGRLLLAYKGIQALGCVALRQLADNTCEMKRLYVKAGSRASGVGHRLVERVIEEARQIGYDQMLLDTLSTMASALRLYARFGFRDVALSAQSY